ncbi:glycosyltransferase family 4 protein [Candidatus Bathyarchaeota archaeon]|nr:glycosyltransferase family 4 protein [Candidatus Bathyarchaeota archaeon]
MKKRIIVIAEYFPPRLGADRRIFELMKRLSQKYDIHFITLPPSYTLFIRKIDLHDTEKREVSYEGMSGHRLSLPTFISRFWTQSFLIAFVVTEIYLCLQMIKKIAQLKPHIIIINDTSAYTGLLGFICSKIMNRKLLVDYNDLMGLYTIELVGKKMSGVLKTIFGRILILIEDTLVRYGWKVTTITSFIKNYALARNIRKDIIVIPNGVDTSLFDPAKVSGKTIKFKYNLQNEEKLCVYAGRVDEVAGAEILLETAMLLKPENIKFMIVGEGNPEMLNKLSKCDNIILTGRVSKESIPEYLAAADCVLVPFPNNVASHGISPLKLFEALAMEKPVIASAISGIEEVVHQDPNVVLVPNEPAHWAAAVKKLVEKNENSQHRINSRKTVREKYDFNHLATLFDKVIESGF